MTRPTLLSAKRALFAVVGLAIAGLMPVSIAPVLAQSASEAAAATGGGASLGTAGDASEQQGIAQSRTGRPDNGADPRTRAYVTAGNKPPSPAATPEVNGRDGYPADNGLPSPAPEGDTGQDGLPSDAPTETTVNPEDIPRGSDWTFFALVAAGISLGLGLLIYAFSDKLFARREEAPKRVRDAGTLVASEAGASAPSNAVVTELGRQRSEIDELRATVEQLKKRINKLDRPPQAGSPPAAPETATAPSAVPPSASYWDTVSSPATATLPAAFGQSFADSPEARALVDAFNNAKSSDFDGLREDYGAIAYTNDRTVDISRIYPNESDRFWLVANPANREEALLLPGFTTKKNWQKLRDDVSDHPFAHHFTLTRGEKLIVHRPALLRRDASNEWVLAEKGELGGLQ